MHTNAFQSVARLSVLGLCLALGGCPKKPASSSRKSTLVVQAETEPAHLINMLQPDGWTHHLTSHNLFESLTRLNPRTYKVEGELASTWHYDSAKKTYTFYLRNGVRWHDGRPFSGEDVKFTFDRLLDEQVRATSMRATLAPHIERYQLLAPDKFQIVCKQDSPFFLVSISDLAILPAHLMKKGDLNTHSLLRKPVGTGPYRFVSWISGRQITLQRFDKYWGTKPRIATIIYRFVQSPEMALNLARRGEIDFISRLRAAQWIGPVKKDPIFVHEFVSIKDYPPGTNYMLLNHQRPLFADVRVRRALAKLIDLPTIAQKIYHGLATPIGSLYWLNEPDYNHQIQPIAFDPAGAKKLLAEAGFKDSDENGVLDRDGEPFRFVVQQFSGSKTSLLWATIWQQELQKVGIVMEINPLEWGVFLQRIRAHDFDAAPLSMRLVGPFSDLYLQFHSSQKSDGQNYGSYSNPAVDDLLVKIRSEMNSQKRRAMSLKVQTLLAEDVAAIPLFCFQDPGLVSRRVHGVYSSAMWYQIRDWWID